MQRDNANPMRNAEGYLDPTPYHAIKHIGVEYKAYKVLQTLEHVARLAGFTLDAITLIDRNGKEYTGAGLVAQYRDNGKHSDKDSD